MNILNLTQHAPSPEQAAAGVYDASALRSAILANLNFEGLPEGMEVFERARNLADIAEDLGASAVMIGGAPFLMLPLQRELAKRGIRPLFAFSKRESVEQVLPDGSVRKTAVFKHLGFVEG